MGYTEITCHLVFDINMGENFSQKSRYLVDVHKEDAPSSLTYFNAVSHDSFSIILTIPYLNSLYLKGADANNSFLTSPNKDDFFLKAGKEFVSI